MEEKRILKSSATKKKNTRDPLFNQSCKEAIKFAGQAQKRYLVKFHFTTNGIKYKITYAKARRPYVKLIGKG